MVSSRWDLQGKRGSALPAPAPPRRAGPEGYPSLDTGGGRRGKERRDEKRKRKEKKRKGKEKREEEQKKGKGRKKKRREEEKRKEKRKTNFLALAS